MPVSWIEHGGCRILYVDFRDLGSAECLATLHDATAAIAAAPEPVLTLVDGRGAKFDSEFMQAAKEVAPQNSQRTRKRAGVGAQGLKGFLVGLYNVAAAPVALRPFPTIEEALAYLTEP
jgi:hypothetical protein